MKQKFWYGNRVQVAPSQSPMDWMPLQGQPAIVLGSYRDLHGDVSTNPTKPEVYCLLKPDGCKSAWYHEDLLTLLDVGGPYLIQAIRDSKPDQAPLEKSLVQIPGRTV